MAAPTTPLETTNSATRFYNDPAKRSLIYQGGVIIARYDLFKTTKSVLSEPQWMGFSAEAYIFVALIYFVCCFFMSIYARRLERVLDTGLSAWSDRMIYLTNSFECSRIGLKAL
jgi:hypothetical protein